MLSASHESIYCISIFVDGVEQTTCVGTDISLFVSVPLWSQRCSLVKSVLMFIIFTILCVKSSHIRICEILKVYLALECHLNPLDFGYE